MLTATRSHSVKCHHCDCDILSTVLANKLKRGKWLCFYDGRIKNLHDASKIWIESIAKNINNNSV